MTNPLQFLPEFYQHILIILSIYIITWHKALWGGWLIDDDMGIQPFSERYDPKEDKVIDSYKEGDKEYKFLSYQAHLGFPGAFMRWHRLNIGKKFAEIGKNSKGHEIYGYVQDPVRHHIWSLTWYGTCLILCYTFLNHLFGSSIAFGATLLFAVHPIISQCIAWISGINYVYCLTFLLANYNLLQLNLSYHWTIPLTMLCTALSSLSLLVGVFNCVILYTLGYPWEAFSAMVVGGLIFLKDGIGVVSFRRKAFKEQNMTNSITPNVRKPIVMLKTLWYYVCLCIYPKSLGLYHEFGYHYSRKDEEPDGMYWGGLLCLIAMALAFFMGGFIAKFCIVWFLSYILVFSNFLTANQFVVERYAFIPSLAFCILFAVIVYPIQPLFWFLIGLYMMRSIMHVWTFKDHVSFYQSNIHNFPKSEVAYGNLGVAYQGRGKSGTAFDLWQTATEINPHYDVPFYNMHSLVKNAGQLEQAREYLKRCMNAKVVHFKGTWEREMAELDNAILKKQAMDSLNNEMNRAINEGKPELIAGLKEKMEMLSKPGTIVKQEPPKTP